MSGCRMRKVINEEKVIFCSNTVSDCTLKVVQKELHKKTNAFPLHFIFWREQNFWLNLTSKIIKMCEQMLKKTVP